MDLSREDAGRGWNLSYETLATRFGLPKNEPGLLHGGTAGQVVYNALRNRIVRLELAPGQPLVRSELVEEYGFSLTPVRDALQQLCEEGLVDIFPQSRTVVSPIDAEAVIEAHFMRMAVESEVALELAGSISEEDLNRVEQIFTLQREVGQGAIDIPLFQELDEFFHQALFYAADKLAIQRLLRSRAGDLERLRRIYIDKSERTGRTRAQSVLSEHEAILEGLRARDPRRAVEAMRTHINGTMLLIDDKRAAFPEYFNES